MKQCFELVGLTPPNGPLQIGQIFGEALQHFQHRLVIIDEDVAPHNRIRRRNPREVTEAGGGKPDDVVFQLAFQIHRRADNGISDQVWKVRCQRQHLVVVIGIHPLTYRSHRRHESFKSGDLVLRHLARDEQPVAAGEEIGETCRRS